MFMAVGVFLMSFDKINVKRNFVKTCAEKKWMGGWWMGDLGFAKSGGILSYSEATGKPPPTGSSYPTGTVSPLNNNPAYTV